MKTFFSPFIVFVLFISCNTYPSCIIRDSVTTDIEYIKQKVNEIEKKLSHMNKGEFNIYGISSEVDAETVYSNANSEVKMYLSDRIVMKIEAIYTGVQETLFSSYYVCNDSLLYVEKTIEIYNPPKWHQDSKITKKMINKYYLKNNKIIDYSFTNGIIWRNTTEGIDINLKAEEIIKDLDMYINFYKKLGCKN